MSNKKSETPMMEKLMKEHEESNTSVLTITAKTNQEGTGAEYSVSATNSSSVVLMGMGVALIQGIRDNIFDGDGAETIAALMSAFVMTEVEEKKQKEKEDE